MSTASRISSGISVVSLTSELSEDESKKEERISNK